MKGFISDIIQFVNVVVGAGALLLFWEYIYNIFSHLFFDWIENTMPTGLSLAIILILLVTVVVYFFTITPAFVEIIVNLIKSILNIILEVMASGLPIELARTILPLLIFCFFFVSYGVLLIMDLIPPVVSEVVITTAGIGDSLRAILTIGLRDVISLAVKKPWKYTLSLMITYFIFQIRKPQKNKIL